MSIFRKADVPQETEDDLRMVVEGDEVEGFTASVYDGEYRLYKCRIRVKKNGRAKSVDEFPTEKQATKVGLRALANERSERKAVLEERERRERTRTKKEFK